MVALAGEWDFPEALELAKDKLKDKVIDPIEKIGLAQQYYIPEWLYTSYAVLTMRETSLSEDEAEVLRARLSIKLSKAREELYKAKMADSQSVKRNNLGKTVLKILVDLFGEIVRTYLKDDNKIFGGIEEVDLDDSRAMARAVGDCESMLIVSRFLTKFLQRQCYFWGSYYITCSRPGSRSDGIRLVKQTIFLEGKNIGRPDRSYVLYSIVS